MKERARLRDPRGTGQRTAKRRLVVLAAAALGVTVALAAPVQAGAGKAREDLERTLAHFEEHLVAGALEDELGPYIVEAALAAGRDPSTWPAAAPVEELALELLEEMHDRALIQRLRPAYALALSGHLTIDDAPFRRITYEFDGTQFGDASALNDDMWAILALRAAGLPATDDRIQAAATFLLSGRGEDGGWSWSLGGPSETDTTGFALKALRQANRLDPAVAERALGFIAEQTVAHGGVAAVCCGPPNCNSTVWAIRAFVEAGKPAPDPAWSFLHFLSRGDGSYAYSELVRSPSLICTAEVATLLGDALREGWPLDGYGGADGRGAPSAALPAAAVAFLAVAAVRRCRQTCN